MNSTSYSFLIITEIYIQNIGVRTHFEGSVGTPTYYAKSFQGSSYTLNHPPALVVNGELFADSSKSVRSGVKNFLSISFCSNYSSCSTNIEHTFRKIKL